MLVIAHGAGAGMDHPFLVGFAGGMNEQGVATMRFNFPYMEAGRRSPGAPGGGRGGVAGRVRGRDGPGGRRAGRGRRQVLRRADGERGGRRGHAGGRPGVPRLSAARARHSPTRSGTSISTRSRCPMLFLHGTGDAFAQDDLLQAVVKKLGRRATLHQVEGGDHSFNVRGVKASPRDVGASLAPVGGRVREGSLDAAEEPPRSQRLRGARAAGAALRRAAVGDHARLRRPPGRRREGVPLSGLRPRDPRRHLAPRRGAAGRPGLAPALAHGVLAERDPAARPPPLRRSRPEPPRGVALAVYDAVHGAGHRRARAPASPSRSRSGCRATCAGIPWSPSTRTTSARPATTSCPAAGGELVVGV